MTSAEDASLVAEPDRARLGDVGKHAEVGMLPFAQATVGDDHPKRVEVADAGIGILRRDRASGVGLGDRDDGPTDRDPVADPGVLLVRLGAHELDEHPKPSRIDVFEATLAGELAERAVGDDAGRVARPSAAGPLAANEADRAAAELREGFGPRTDDDMTDARSTVDGRLDVLAEAD